MRHLTDDRLAELARGRTRDGEDHVARCPRCRERLEAWRRWLEGLAEVAREAVRPDELHRLRTMFAILGPAARRREARLVRAAGAPALAGVRGAGPELLTFEAGGARLVVEVRPGAGGRWSVHGRATGLGETSGAAAAVSREGAAAMAPLDEEGEFHLEGLPPGVYRLVVAAAGERLVVEELAVGGEG